MEKEDSEPKLKKACSSVKDLEKLLAAGCAPNLVLSGGGSLLAHACKQKSDEAALCLLKWGADPNARDASGKSALAIAAGRNMAKLCKALLSARADPMPLGPVSQSPLALAAENGAMAAMAPLLSAVRKSGTKDGPLGRSLMHVHINKAARAAWESKNKACYDMIKSEFVNKKLQFTTQNICIIHVQEDGTSTAHEVELRSASGFAFFSSRRHPLIFNSTGRSAFACGNAEMANLKKGQAAGKFEMREVAHWGPEQTRSARQVARAWEKRQRLEDSEDDSCKAYFDFLLGKPDATEVELEGLSRPIFEGNTVRGVREIFENTFNGLKEREEASRAAMGDMESSPAKATRASEGERLEKLEIMFDSLREDGAGLDEARVEKAKACAEQTFEAVARHKRSMASVWGSRRLYCVDAELVDQFARMDLPKKEDGVSLAAELVMQSPSKGFVLGYGVEMGSGNGMGRRVEQVLWSVGIESNGRGVPVLWLSSPMEPMSKAPLCLEVLVGGDFGEAELRDAVKKGLAEAKASIEAPWNIAKMSVSEAIEKAMPEIKRRPDLNEAGIDEVCRQAKIALNAIFYTCCSNPQVIREGVPSSQRGRLSSFSQRVEVEAAKIKAPQNPSQGWDALWLGVKFGDLVRKARQSADGAEFEGDDGVRKRAVRPHPRVGYWRGVWCGPMNGVRKKRPTYIDATFVGAKSISDVEFHRPKGYRS